MSNSSGVRKGNKIISPHVEQQKQEALKRNEELTKLNEALKPELASSLFRARVVEEGEKTSKRLNELKSEWWRVKSDVNALETKLYRRNINAKAHEPDEINIKRLDFPYEIGEAERSLYMSCLGNQFENYSFDTITGNLDECIKNSLYSLIHKPVKKLFELRNLYKQYHEDYCAIQRVENDLKSLMAHKEKLEVLLTDAIQRGVPEEEVLFTQEEATTSSSARSKASHQNVMKAFFAILMFLIAAIFYKLA